MFNVLTELDLSKNTVLTELHCEFNSLKILDVSLNSQLTELNCSNNSIDCVIGVPEDCTLEGAGRCN